MGTVSPRHWLLIRRHLATGELAFAYCHVPGGQPVSMTRLIRAAGLRWPVEEDSGLGKDCSGLDEPQVCLCTDIARHTVLIMAALAICAVTAALLRCRTGTQAAAPATPGHAAHWLDWRRRHQARSRWHQQRARLTRDAEITQVSSDWLLSYQAGQARQSPALQAPSWPSMASSGGRRPGRTGGRVCG